MFKLSEKYEIDRRILKLIIYDIVQAKLVQ